jgi:hypothetical protein
VTDIKQFALNFFMHRSKCTSKMNVSGETMMWRTEKITKVAFLTVKK